MQESRLKSEVDKDGEESQAPVTRGYIVRSAVPKLSILVE